MIRKPPNLNKNSFNITLSHVWKKLFVPVDKIKLRVLATTFVRDRCDRKGPVENDFKGACGCCGDNCFDKKVQCTKYREVFVARAAEQPALCHDSNNVFAMLAT